MRAIDLRIGNYFYEMKNGLICSVEQVKDIGSSGVNHYNFGDECVLFKEYKPSKHQFYAEPIPLTEEWLLKFGFFLSEESDTYNKCNESYNEMCIEGYLQKEMNVTDINVRLKHVHQLQNLYHALTGEELKVKELA